MGEHKYTPHIVLHLGARACACCGIRWDGQVVNGRHMKETAAWEDAGLAVCRACLGRFVRWAAEGAVPPDRAENFVFFTWAGWEIVQEEWKRRLAMVCPLNKQDGGSDTLDKTSPNRPVKLTTYAINHNLVDAPRQAAQSFSGLARSENTTRSDPKTRTVLREKARAACKKKAAPPCRTGGEE